MQCAPRKPDPPVTRTRSVDDMVREDARLCVCEKLAATRTYIYSARS